RPRQRQKQEGGGKPGRTGGAGQSAAHGRQEFVARRSRSRQELGSVTRSMFVCKLGLGRRETCFAWRAAAAHRAALRRSCANRTDFHRSWYTEESGGQATRGTLVPRFINTTTFAARDFWPR